MTEFLRHLSSGGESLAVDCDLPWVRCRITEGADGQLTAMPAGREITVRVTVEASSRAFTTSGWSRITRDASTCDGRVVIEDVATSGFDMLVSCEESTVDFVCRWRPGWRTRAAATLLRDRARLLIRAVLLQYPVMWAAGLRGRVPLHACGVVPSDTGGMLIVGPSGVGKTTLVEREIAFDGRATADNMCLTDGNSVWGVVEPVRSEQGTGRSVTHGRRESHLRGRVPVVAPQAIVVLEHGEQTMVRASDPGAAARALVASTYSAGELRRYWPVHAVLALGTARGEAHPPVAEMAAAICARLPCLTVTLAGVTRVRLAELIADSGVAA
jgi:hypothetical protein